MHIELVVLLIEKISNFKFNCFETKNNNKVYDGFFNLTN